MKKIWTIKLLELKNGKYGVRLSYMGRKEIRGTGNTPQKAYADAENKMIIKPWLINPPQKTYDDINP